MHLFKNIAGKFVGYDRCNDFFVNYTSILLKTLQLNFVGYEKHNGFFW